MRWISLVLLGFSIFWSTASAQIAIKPTKTLFIQSRHSHTSNFLMSHGDIGIGFRTAMQLNNRMNLNFGLTMNYSRYQKETHRNGELFYYDYFKGLRIDYFYIQEVAQWSLEIPLSFQYSVYTKSTNTVGLVVGISPQMCLSSRASGFGFSGKRVVKTNFTNGHIALNKMEGNLDRKSHYVISDMNLNLGLSWSHNLENGKTLVFESGFERSVLGYSNGMFVRIGIGL